MWRASLDLGMAAAWPADVCDTRPTPRAPTCTQADPEALRDRLEQTLGNAGIKYSYSSASKFKNFVNRTLV